MNKKSKTDETDLSIAMRVSKVSIVINLILSAIKFLAGIFAHSGAIISDAIHSASDVLSTIVVMIGVNLASKQPDKKHPYGHDRMECVAALLLSIALFLTGAGIGFGGIRTIINSSNGITQTPGVFAAVAAVLSIGIKEWMYWYTKFAADKIHSGALKADAWHHRSDALSSVGALIGIIAARKGYPIMDAVASVVICLFIIKVSIDIFIDSIDKMIDKACDEQTCNEMTGLIKSIDGVVLINQMNTRLFGSNIYVDVEIEVDCNSSLNNAHNIAENIHTAIEKNFPRVKHCMVHVNPACNQLKKTE